MSEAVHENFIRTYWATTIAAISAPTVAEITAATFLGEEQTADGLNLSPTNNKASLQMLNTEKIPEHPGTQSLAVTLQFRRQTEEADDVAWELFDHNTAGFLIVARLVASTDPVATDRVEVYQAKSFEPVPLQSAADTYQQYQVELALQDWDKKAVVAA